MIYLMYVVDHKERGNRASFDGIGIDRSSAAQAGSIFDVKMFFCKTDGSYITVYRFQIDRGKCRKDVFRAVCSIAIIRKNQRTFIGNGIYGAFQEITLPKKRCIEGYSSDYEEEYADRPNAPPIAVAVIVQNSAKPIQNMAKIGRMGLVCKAGILPGLPVQRTVSS